MTWHWSCEQLRFSAGKRTNPGSSRGDRTVKERDFQLLLDTGATTSLIKNSALIYLGIDPDRSNRRIQMTTGSGSEVVPIVVLTRFSALGQHRFGFSIIAHTLPANSAVDGLLGLDFLRNHVLTIDFPGGRITLA